MEIILWLIGGLAFSFVFVVFFGAPYVPTLKGQTHEILNARPLRKSDVFIDIGSGDGVILRMAADKCKQAIGYELNPWLYWLSKFLSRKQDNVSIKCQNFWSVKLPKDTSVVYAFFDHRFMQKIDQKLQLHVNLHKTSIDFISYGFKLPGREYVAAHGPMYVYRFEPLQT